MKTYQEQRPQMKLETYDRLKAEGYGTAFCDTCRVETEFTHDEYGSLFCISCGNEPEVQKGEEEQ